MPTSSNIVVRPRPGLAVEHEVQQHHQDAGHHEDHRDRAVVVEQLAQDPELVDEASPMPDASGRLPR